MMSLREHSIYGAVDCNHRLGTFLANTYLVLCVFCFFGSSLFAQYYPNPKQPREQGRLTALQLQQENTLLQRLETARDTQRIEILNALAWIYRGTDFARAMQFARQAENELHTMGYPRVRAENNNYIGIIYRNIGNYPKAMEYFTEARRIAEKYNYKREMGYALNNIGDIYRYTQQYDEARKYVLQSQEIFRTLPDSAGLHYCSIRLGEIDQSLKKYSSALRYFQDALGIAERLKNEVWQSGVLNRVGQVYRAQDLIERALETFKRAIAIAERLPHNEDEQAYILIEMAKAHLMVNAQDSAIAYLERGIALAEKIGSKQYRREAAKTLAEVLTTKRQFEKALYYRNLQLAMNDSLFSDAGRREIEKLSAKYELEKQQNAIAVLSQTQRQERIVVVIMAVCLVLVVIIAILFFRNSRQEHRANAEIMRQQTILGNQAYEIEANSVALQEQNIELLALNAEKTELMNIVAHDLKNPIGAIQGLAELITSGFANQRITTESAEQIADTARRMFTLVTNLLDSNRLESGVVSLQIVEFDAFPVVEAVVEQYQSAADTKDIRLHLQAENNEALVYADEQALMQVLDNLVSNAVKYSPHGKQVFVRLRSHSPLGLSRLSEGGISTNAPMTNAPMPNDQFLRIEVQDEGPGISPDDMQKLFGKFARLSARPTGGEHSTGLGLSIVKKMVEAMNGRTWCESELGKGATFFVELPRSQE